MFFYNAGMVTKTLAMKLLDKQQVPYNVVTYPPTERDAAKLADLFGVPAAEVFKSLVVVREPEKPLLVMVPADKQLDLKSWRKWLAQKAEDGDTRRCRAPDRFAGGWYFTVGFAK